MELVLGYIYEIYNLNWSFIQFKYGVGSNFDKTTTVLLERTMYFDGTNLPRFDIDRMDIHLLVESQVIKSMTCSLFANGTLIKTIETNFNDSTTKNRDYFVFKITSIIDALESDNSVTRDITSYDGAGDYVNFPLNYTEISGFRPIGNISFELKAISGYSLYKVPINIQAYVDYRSSGGSWDDYGVINLNSLIVDDVFRSNIVFTYPLDVNGDPIAITTKHVYFDDADQYDVIPVDLQGFFVDYPVNYGEDLTVTFKCIRNANNYHFSEQSVNDYINLLKEYVGWEDEGVIHTWEEFFESVDGSLNETMDRMSITIHKVVDIFDLDPNGSIENLHLIENPTVTYNLSHCSIDNPPSHANYKGDLDLDIEIDENYRLEENNIKILIGGIETDNWDYDAEHNELHIYEVTEDVEITVTATPDWAIKVHNRTGADTLTYIGSQFVDSLLMILNDNVITVKVNGTSLGTLTVPLEDEEEIIGLGIGDSQEVFVPINVTINNIDISQYGEDFILNLYPIIVDTSEPTTFEMNLYNMNCDKNVVDKSSKLVAVSTLTGTLRSQCDILNPVILIETTRLPRFNYVYIDAFKRYYFVNEVTIVTNKTYNISLHVDVLMSYRNEIRSQTCMVARNEFEFDRDIEDLERKKYNKNGINIIDITQSATTPFDAYGLYKDDVPIVIEVMGEN